MGKVTVPEWVDESGEAVVIYVRPITLAERNKIYRYTIANSLDALVETLIQRARDIDGKAMFTYADKSHLRHGVDPNVIERVTIEINTLMPEVLPQDVEKN
jgi:hypothetical protein